MKPRTPRFTDMHRQPAGGYVHSDYHDIRRTFARALGQQLRPGEDPLDPSTWVEHHQSANTHSTTTTKD